MRQKCPQIIHKVLIIKLQQKRAFSGQMKGADLSFPSTSSIIVPISIPLLEVPMLKEGQKAPDFKLDDQTGKPVSLKDFKGKTLVLYFYPKDMTPGCTQEACDFRDN